MMKIKFHITFAIFAHSNEKKVESYTTRNMMNSFLIKQG